MKRKQFLACLLTALITSGIVFDITTINANAQAITGEPAALFLPSEDSKVSMVLPSKETQSANYKGNNEITSMSIDGLDNPQDGKLLDFSAVVTTDNGAVWKIPVIWADEAGNISTVKAPNVSSYPVFAFYVPQGYTLKDAATFTERISLPKVATDLYGGRSIVKIVDPKSGWVFITCVDGPGKNLKAEVAASNYADVVKHNGEIEKERRNPSGEFTLPELTREQQLIAMHCDASAIENVDAAELAALVELIRYSIQPRAINLIIDGFPCFDEALKNGELSSVVGLYIFYDASPNAPVAYVKPGNDEHGYYMYSICINAACDECDLQYDENIGWYSTVAQRGELDSTLIHELFHMFMFDYTASGMSGMRDINESNVLQEDPSATFPNWFKEGMATTVDNVYQFRSELIRSEKYGFYDLYGDGVKTGFETDALEENYKANANIQLSYGEKDENKDNLASSYVSGYLACMYLGYLASENPAYRSSYGIQGSAIIQGENGYSIDNSVIRQGLSAILSEIHGCRNNDGKWQSKSLDEVINDLLGDKGVNNTDKFQADFIVNIPGSAVFCTELLNYAEESSRVGGHFVNGSVLLPAESTAVSPITDDISAEPAAYRITDNQNPGEWHYENTDAFNTFLDGGKSPVGINGINGTSTNNGQVNAPAAKVDATNISYENESIILEKSDEDIITEGSVENTAESIESTVESNSSETTETTPAVEE